MIPNFIGPILVVLLIASIIGIVIGLIKKHKVMLTVSSIVFILALCVYLFDFFAAA
jgi:hypothetical protein